MTGRLHWAAIGVVGLPFLGCATIGQRPPVHQDRVVRSAISEVQIAGAHADVNQEGTTIHMAVTHICNVKRDNVIDRTSTTEFTNSSSKQTWLAAGAGLVSTVAGVALVVDSTSTYPNDKTSRTYNSTGPGNERLYGFGLIGVGAVLGTIAIVDAIRANGSSVERSQVMEEAGFVKRSVVCSNQPAANLAITGRLGAQSIMVGQTDAQGKLHADLERVISEDTILAKSASKLTLLADGHECATVNLVPVYLRREGKAFEDSQLEGCAKPATSGSCNRLKSFLSDFPDGPHSAAASATLDSARPIINQMADDEAWARSPSTGCTKSTTEDPAEVHSACEPLRYYLARYPEGRHATEASKALEVGDAREKHLNAEIARREKAAQAKEAADERRECIAVCKMGCLGWQIRDAATCFSGCVESRCSGGEQ